MSGHIPAALVRDVIARASDLCEYCQLPQETQEATFHVDHILPRVQDGPTVPENLALACVTCSLKKSVKVGQAVPDAHAHTFADTLPVATSCTLSLVRQA